MVVGAVVRLFEEEEPVSKRTRSLVHDEVNILVLGVVAPESSLGDVEEFGPDG